MTQTTFRPAMGSMSLCFQPSNGAPQSVQIEGITLQDFVFALAFIQAHSQASGAGEQARVSAAAALQKVRNAYEAQVRAEVRSVISEALGVWESKLPPEIVQDLREGVLSRVGHIRPETMAELHDTYSRIVALQGKVSSLIPPQPRPAAASRPAATKRPADASV